jgi:hypothetical protein
LGIVLLCFCAFSVTEIFQDFPLTRKTDRV